MKAILEFNIEEERDQLDLALDGWAYKACLTDLLEWIRGKTKHTELPEEVERVYADVRNKIVELCDYREIPLN